MIPNDVSSPLAAGRYEYQCDGKPVPLAETWQLRQFGSGYEISSVREVPSLSLRISARVRIDESGGMRGLLKWCEGGDVPLALATYRCEPDNQGRSSNARYRYRRPGSPAQSFPAAEMHFFPLMRIFAGQLLTGLATAGGRGEILVPWIQDPGQRDKLFMPDVSSRRLEYLGQESVGQSIRGLVGESEEVSSEQVERYRYSGGQYENGSEYLLCDGLLREYCWVQGEKEWQVQLQDFSGQWPGAVIWGYA
ncbi:hypothetical protein Mag101_09790 [Microbulbifer agarilyticus]|uniref:Uncharacterized protein n=1 Tax=Microbulbifer agarilyticus TaxID=260552 RepID=A0A1Q2M5E5_9GAMM|nr:hypothetical protein [Microbulbifer agarilyticus]AQQ67901.1 hypothetical protein Mag101_09790 [Microbulbifer agarilyticus]